MSTTIDEAFTRQYERDVHDVFQTEGSLMKSTVRFRPGVKGKSTTFQKIGKGTATTKARHGTITPMNQTHNSIECNLSDFYAGDWVDQLDEAKTNIDERKAIASGGAWALGRKVDEQIFTALDSTSQTPIALDDTSFVTIRNSMIAIVGALIGLESYRRGELFGVLSPFGWQLAMLIEQFANADWVGLQGAEFNKTAPVNGSFKEWMGVMWTVHPATLGVNTATSKGFLWNKNAIGYAAGDHPANLAGTMAGESSVGADITWHGDRAAHFINHAMSGGGCMIDDTGVIEITIDDTASLPAS